MARLMNADAFFVDLTNECYDVHGGEMHYGRFDPAMGYSEELIERVMERQNMVDDNLVNPAGVAKALDIAFRYSQIDGAWHKAWCIDQMVRALTGDNYDAWVENYKHHDLDDPDDYYNWNEGIAP